jgi:hypothetical protein
MGNNMGRNTPTGVITEFASPTAGSSPSGIALGRDGNLWFTEEVGNRIGRLVLRQDPPDASALIKGLIQSLDSFQLDAGITNSLEVKLQHAQAAATSGAVVVACNVLNAFSNEVQAQSGKHVSAGQASQLLSGAASVKAALPKCP